MAVEDLIKTGARARLFPVLSENSKEGRATSIFLACLAVAPDLAVSLFGTINRRIGIRTQIEVYTEVGVNGKNQLRPDGLIILRTGKKVWTALLEAKVGSHQLDQKQIEAYLDLARCHHIDAVITLSNQFVTNPSLNPVQVSRKKTRTVDLYHWSWMLVLTHCTLLLGNEQVRDEDQSRILSEFVLFLSHDSTGVKGFESMPKSWANIVNKFSSGEKLNKTDAEISELISAWHQEEKDICLILSRIIQNTVIPKLPRSAQKDVNARRKADIESLCTDHSFRSILSVPNAAAPINIKVDLASRYIQVSMRIQAPADKVTGVARINWLLRQLSNPKLKEGIDIISNWPGKTGGVRSSIAQIRENPEFALNNDRSNAPTSFEIVMFSAVKAGRFKSRKGFVVELENLVTKFYELIGQNLKAWQPSAPKVKSKSASTKAVSTETIQEDFEERQSDES